MYRRIRSSLPARERSVARLATAFVLAGMVAATGARAQEAADDERPTEARKACLAGEVERGVKLLVEYFAATEDPTVIYNIGRCYEQNGMEAKAVPKFREYLRKAKDLSAEERLEIERRIADLETVIRARATPAPVSDKRGQLPAVTAPPALAQKDGDAGSAGEVSAGRSRSLRTAGIATAAAGVATVGTGIFFGLRARSLEDRIENGSRYDPADLDAGRTARTTQFVLYGVGAAAVIGGAVLYYLGMDQGQRVTVAPSMSAQALGAQLRIRL